MGKVHIITGGYAGIGVELARVLYAKNATVYLAGRSESKASTAITELRNGIPNSNGRLEFLYVDLADLSTIKPAVQSFLSKEERLDVLVNNAGIMASPEGSKSKQGYDLQIATNVYGPFMFTNLLRLVLVKTAAIAEKGTVRVIWAASTAIELTAPEDGVQFASSGESTLIKEDLGNMVSYGHSKAANIMLSIEVALNWGEMGIISNSFNPGNLKSELTRHGDPVTKLFAKLIAHPVKMGAWTELFAGWSSSITLDTNGCYVIPWGRIGTYNNGLKDSIAKGTEEKLWEICEGIVQPYM